MVGRMVRSKISNGALMLLTIVAGAGLAACSLEPGSGRYRETTIELEPLTVAAEERPIALPARLRDKDGRPVAGARLLFYVRTIPSWSGGAEHSVVIGSETTDVDGRATRVVRGGLEGLLVRGDRLIGYDVGFRPLSAIGGIQYCLSDARTSITVGGGK